MAINWTHITIGVREFERSLKFYEDFCNLRIVRDRRDENDEGTVWLGTQNDEDDYPDFVLVLMKADTISPVDHLGFQCDSIDAVDKIADRARENGILAFPPKDSGGAVGYWTIVKDPDGHFVEFTFGQPIRGLT